MKNSILDFYGKPGCLSNKKQLALLKKAGVEVREHSLLTSDLNSERLSLFFEGQNVQQWINQSAPDVKSGAFDPNEYNETELIEQLLQNPILIRRPLIAFGSIHCCGFSNTVIQRIEQHFQVNIYSTSAVKTDLESCSQSSNHYDPEVSV